MGLPVVVGALVTLAMAAGVWLGILRWPALDAGGRWIVAGLTLAMAITLVMLGMVFRGQHTRPAHELQLLVHTTALLVGFSLWQPHRAARLAIRAAAGGYAALWIGVLVLEGWTGPFSMVSAPVGHTLKVAAAGGTLIALVRTTPELWTRYLWFWCATGTMLIYGTEVILDPLWQRVSGIRDDLLLAAYTFQQLSGLVGYSLIIRGLWPRDPLARQHPAAR